MDLVALFAIGVLGVLLKRFGWSRPAFLIGFVLASQAEGYLNLAVQFYGWGMLARPGVLTILVITLVSVWLGFRGRRNSAELIRHGTDSSSNESPVTARASQRLFLVGAIGVLIYSIWSSLDLSPLGSMFPLAVAVATLALCFFLLGTLTFGSVDDSANVDLEYSGEDEKSGLWITVGWFAAFIATTGLFGFILGTLFFFVAFLRLKARISWGHAIVLDAAALAVLLVLTNTLFVELPGGLLSLYVDLPWPLG
jgi:hypothetical protein